MSFDMLFMFDKILHKINTLVHWHKKTKKEEKNTGDEVSYINVVSAPLVNEFLFPGVVKRNSEEDVHYVEDA